MPWLCSSGAAAVLSTAYAQVFQSAILEAKKYKASGGDALADVLDLLSTRTPSGPAAAAKEGTGREEVRLPMLCVGSGAVYVTWCVLTHHWLLSVCWGV
jgi:hypothetical protein